MKYRHELKYTVNFGDMMILRSRLSRIMQTDPHTADGKYMIRSIYFDTPADSAMREKLDGVSVREKFRIRFYNNDTSLIHLEKKSKMNGLCNKQSAKITEAEVHRIASGDTGFMADHESGLVRELYSKMITKQLAPKTVVDYTREPFVFAPGNVRITLDYEIRTSPSVHRFADPELATVPVPGDPIILEVKWDEFLPSVIRDAVDLGNRRVGAFSKYAACRIYG